MDKKNSKKTVNPKQLQNASGRTASTSTKKKPNNIQQQQRQNPNPRPGPNTLTLRPNRNTVKTSVITNGENAAGPRTATMTAKKAVQTNTKAESVSEDRNPIPLRSSRSTLQDIKSSSAVQIKSPDHVTAKDYQAPSTSAGVSSIPLNVLTFLKSPQKLSTAATYTDNQRVTRSSSLSGSSSGKSVGPAKAMVHIPVESQDSSLADMIQVDDYNSDNLPSSSDNSLYITEEFTKIVLTAALGFSGYAHAVHCMIWAPWETPILGSYDGKVAIMMQMRFDGTLGFPGGMVDVIVKEIPKEDRAQAIVDALQRELKEELGFDKTKDLITQKDNYLFSHRHVAGKLMLHFYQYKMTYEEYCKLELSTMQTSDYGQEVLGICRVPLYTMTNGYHGMPAFLDGVFVGNARDQLIDSLIALDIMSQYDISKVESGCRRNN